MTDPAIKLSNNFEQNQAKGKVAVVSKPSVVYEAKNDGVDHINIWFHGKTQLGQMLSHFYESPFRHPYFGTFSSMEGFWQYLHNKKDDGNRDDSLRSLSGNQAKQHGKSLKWCFVPEFCKIIGAANFYKIEQNPTLRELFVDSSLPFALYFLNKATGDAEGQGDVVVRMDNYQWLVKSFEDNRTLMQFGERPAFINYQELFGAS